MNKMDLYKSNQRKVYDSGSETLQAAKKMVSPSYDKLRESANTQIHFLLADYFKRKNINYDSLETSIEDLKILDFGCGVGRMMEAFAERGCGQIDGVDISAEMLKHAASSPLLRESEFFLSSGADTGNSPSNYYDLAFSVVCMHHICMRQTRIKILEDIARSLNEEGVVCIELRLYPGVTQHKIPRNHAHWSENYVSRLTNSKSDVWVTPDALGLVYQDFNLFFNDVVMVECTLDVDHYAYDATRRYQYCCNRLFVFASKSSSLNRIFG